MSDLIATDMVIGQTAVSTVKDSFRLNVDAVSLEDGMTGTFKAALTDAEILQGRRRQV